MFFAHWSTWRTMSVSQLRKQPTNRFPAATTKVDASDLPFPHGYLVPRRTAGIAAGALRRRPRPSDEVGRKLCKSEPWTWKRFPGMLTHRLRKLQNTLATGPAQRQPETRFASFFRSEFLSGASLGSFLSEAACCKGAGRYLRGGEGAFRGPRLAPRDASQAWGCAPSLYWFRVFS